VRAEEKLKAFVELEAAICVSGDAAVSLNGLKAAI